MKRTFFAIFFSLFFAGIPSSLLFAQEEDPNAGNNDLTTETITLTT